MAEDQTTNATNNAHPDLDALRGGVAIITGSASGIGFALAEASVAYGLHPVIADIEESAIEAAIEALTPSSPAIECRSFWFPNGCLISN